jgi:hypothetical protein
MNRAATEALELDWPGALPRSRRLGGRHSANALNPCSARKGQSVSYYDDEMTDRAVNAYFRRQKAVCLDERLIAQPNATLTCRDGDKITIANINGVLARYRVVRDGGDERIRRID